MLGSWRCSLERGLDCWRWSLSEQESFTSQGNLLLKGVCLVKNPGLTIADFLKDSQ